MWQTKDIEDAKQFLSMVLPHGSSYTYCSSFIGQGVYWRDQVMAHTDALIQSCMSHSEQGHNTYFALSAFREGWHLENNKKVFRTQNNALCQKALWLDIDCGKNACVYQKDSDAINALSQFLQATKLPVPTIVSSGHGLHIYWAFNEAIVTRQWRTLAGILKNLCLSYKFDADHSRTTDPASVLRLPGTNNYDIAHKYDGVHKRVKILHLGTTHNVIDIAGALIQAAKTGNVQLQASTMTVPVPSVNGTVAPVTGTSFDNMEDMFTGPKRKPSRIIKECKQIQQAGIGTYTQWYNMMTVMRHCINGEAVVHAISKTDARRYDYNNVQEKYQQAVDGGSGPCRCETFDLKDPGICSKCPYWGKIATPLLLGEPATETKPLVMPPPVVSAGQSVLLVSNSAVPTMEVLPYSDKEFSVVPGQGIVWHKRELVAGEQGGGDEADKHFITKDILINDVEIYIHSVCIDTTGSSVKRSYVLRKKVSGRAAEDILFDIDMDLGPQNIIKWLANHGMMPRHPKFNKAMGDFMSTYLAAVQNRLPEILVRDTFGWVRNQDTTTGEYTPGFIVGKKMFTAKGEEDVRLTERADMVAHEFTTAGRLEMWKHVPDMYRVLNQPFPALMVCASLAAPFMRLGAGVATNVAYSLWDIKGGKGKSTVLEACASIWGNPVNMLQTRSDTPASRFQKFAVYKNLPIMVDEITTMKDAEMTDLIYDIVNGREKSRSTASGTGLAKQGKWSTVTLFTSNKSLYETLRSYRSQSEATQMRVIELQCDFKNYTDEKTCKYISLICKTIRGNYGLAGQEFMRYYMAHPECEQEIRDFVDAFVRRNLKSSDERFWMHGLAIPLAVARIAVRAGLLTYDVDNWLVPYVEQILLPHLRMSVKTDYATGENLLSDFLSENLSSTLIVGAANRTAAEKDPGVQSGIDSYVKQYPLHELTIRQEMDTNTFYVSSRQFTLWCQKNNYSLEVILQNLESKGIWKRGDKLQYSLGRCVSAIDRSRTIAYKFILKV